jgi:hypothetical protein
MGTMNKDVLVVAPEKKSHKKSDEYQPIAFPFKAVFFMLF